MITRPFNLQKIVFIAGDVEVEVFCGCYINKQRAEEIAKDKIEQFFKRLERLGAPISFMDNLVSDFDRPVVIEHAGSLIEAWPSETGTRWLSDAQYKPNKLNGVK